MLSKENFILFVWVWIGIALLLFPVLFRVTAPYGRHSNKKWGPTLSNRLGWIIMEMPAFVVFSFLAIKGGGIKDAVILLASFLWMAHYVNRTLIFPLRIKTNNKRMPLAIVGMAFFFNLVNGFVNGYWLGYLSPSYSADWFSEPRFILGAILFICGFLINQYYDNKLISLRRNNKGSKYLIPRGGLFNYISCPNFLGEIIEWGGFALLTWCLPSFSFFVWTAVNLIPRAIDHHRWYRSYFDDYPLNRKAIVPFIL